MRALIVNADDLGMPKGTVAATSDLYALGVVTSTTAMVNQADWPAAAEFLSDHPKLGAGVHLVMNDGHPLLSPDQVPSLVDREGRFRDGLPLLLRYGRLRIAELEAEWRAQIERFRHDVGRAPGHLDLHCRWPYVFPAWFQVSLKLAQAYGGLPVRMPFDKALGRKAKKMSADSGFPAWYIRWQGRRYQRMIAERGLRSPDYFEQSFSQQGGRTVDHLLALLAGLPEGVTELLTHPGTEGWRVEDYQVLRDPRIVERMAELGIELVDYGVCR